ncbi:MAG: hypothetical protein IPL57_10410 [Rubrivivax sp.]|nr:hypothetical protein [Rubrivivax sp.]
MTLGFPGPSANLTGHPEQSSSQVGRVHEINDLRVQARNLLRHVDVPICSKGNLMNARSLSLVSTLALFGALGSAQATTTGGFGACPGISTGGERSSVVLSDVQAGSPNTYNFKVCNNSSSEGESTFLLRDWELPYDPAGGIAGYVTPQAGVRRSRPSVRPTRRPAGTGTHQPGSTSAIRSMTPATWAWIRSSISTLAVVTAVATAAWAMYLLTRSRQVTAWRASDSRPRTV